MAIFVPDGMNRYQCPNAGEESIIYVKNVHFQFDNTTVIGAGNDAVQLKGIIFVDAKLSTPALDYEDLQRQTQELGGVMQCMIKTRRGTEIGPMNVITVEALPDDEANVHHWELGVC